MSIPKRSSSIPFGYVESETDSKILEEVPEQLAALEEIASLVRENTLSLREGAAWLEYKTGRKLSHQGLNKIIHERLGN